VHLSPHIIRLRPAPHCATPIRAYTLGVEPNPHFLNWQQDPFGNIVAHVVFPEPAENLEVVVDLVADLAVVNPFDFFVDEYARSYPFRYQRSLADDLGPYLRVDEADTKLAAWTTLAQVDLADRTRPVVDFLVDLNRRVQGAVSYTVRLEPGVQQPDETLREGLGSCRDSAWLLVQVLRHLGLASRFVSGYLIQLVADEAPVVGPAGPSDDFTDLHAWAEVYLPGAGWIGLDPTSGLLAGEGHVPLACTPDPGGAAAIVGAVDPCEVILEYSNVVRRVREDPRVSRPYSDEQWASIDAVAVAVDAELAEGDVRLTMGGEPTFVSAEKMEGAEWNTAADGEDKWRLAWDLTRRLADRFAPGALVHYGQGKWYPGEVLPRWQLGVYWRADSEALWQDPTLLADPDCPSNVDGAAVHDLALAITAGLGIPDECCLAASEPGPLEQRPNEFPAGWVIPLHPLPSGDAWGTSRWKPEGGSLMLIPGDSPIGLRLPLDQLRSARPVDPERSPFDPRKGLRSPHRRVPTAAPAVVVRPEEAPPTALCVERRGGHLRVFLPPLSHLERFVDLLAVIEAAAAGRHPVVVEGYPPPVDPRLRQFVIGPDPGVIEVNLPPMRSWPELVEMVTELYEHARQVGLTTEKFALDGTHTGTGGGNHVTLGGPTAADSPMLRRPDLLRSLLTFWQHHPSLSYLFSGRFIGVTSQAPRVDEGRYDSLDELEIAFEELDRLDGGPRHWLVDRLFRHLLVDVTGNTHRAEFCIDKLFSPDSERGRQGLVELRNFEMPPRARMALVQALLVRTLVARFWRAPYAGRLVRWGTELHDRFMLPWYVAADAADVVDDLRRHGYQFETTWLAPFLEFRFPPVGSVDIGGVHLELRTALEPWPVLGEEPQAGGTSRAVDSSLERLQVLADGLVEGRHLVTCNGAPVPLRPTGSGGTRVAGVRFRAWQPPSCLHPTIGVHAPLVFDLIDIWAARSLGGCTYFVGHPGGRSYERFPRNEREAEARRSSRFQPFGHTPGELDVEALRALYVTAAGGADRYPHTLDLRRSAPPGG
jgi:uncharacterized protein (DUF2126 family)/transglutaminase-like putative cysteine protease